MVDIYLKLYVIRVVRLICEHDNELGSDVCFRVVQYWYDVEKAHRSDSASLS